LSKWKNLDDICKELWEDSISGLISEFLLRNDDSLEKIMEKIRHFGIKEDDSKYKFGKMLEICLATVHGVQLYPAKFPNYHNRSAGYCLGRLLYYFHKRMNDED
jgi:hypothetical protein